MKKRGLTDEQQAVLWHLTRVVPKADRLSADAAGELFGIKGRTVRRYIGATSKRAAKTEAAYNAVVAHGALPELLLRVHTGRGLRPLAPNDAPPTPEPLKPLPQVGATVDEALPAAIDSVRKGTTPLTALVQAGVLRATAKQWLDQADKGDGHHRIFQAEADHLAQLEQGVARGGADARIKLDILERRDPETWRPTTDIEFTDRSALAGIDADRIRAELARTRGES